MARMLIVVALAALLAATVSAQEDTAACINLGRPLLTNCASEIAALAAAGYPLTSESAPEDQGSDLEVSEGCCTSLGPFIENSCQCNTGLPDALTGVGVSASSTGLQGTAQIFAESCGIDYSAC